MASTTLGSQPSTCNETSTTLSPVDQVVQQRSGHTVRKGERRVVKMRTGCISCLIKRIPCDPENSACRLNMPREWPVGVDGVDGVMIRDNSTRLKLFQPDLKWRRTWRERQALNFFVAFTAPQMGGFFEASFWLRSVVRASYMDPAIMHVVTAIGSLHEAIMQRAFSNEKRKEQAMEYALMQCNHSISLLTGAGDPASSEVIVDTSIKGVRPPDTRILLMACVLFTCFEAMQGRCDSAVQHAIQGRKLLADATRSVRMPSEPEDDSIEDMRLIIDRLAVQAVSLTGKGERLARDTTNEIQPMPPIDRILSIRQAEHGLHHCLNSIMRYMQAFHPNAPPDHIAITMAEKHLRFAPWLKQWSVEFALFLTQHIADLSDLDLKRCLVLKINHLLASMLASVNQSLGPAAYDGYETQFKMIVDWSREILRDFSCPPLPTLRPSSPSAPYLSFSLWVTDPLWMVISRCRDPTIRQSAFTLLSQHPRQEGIWHAGPATQTRNQCDRQDLVTRTVAADTSAQESTVGTTTYNSPDIETATTSSSRAHARIQSAETRLSEKAYSFGSKGVRGKFLDLERQNKTNAPKSDENDTETLVSQSRFEPKVWPTAFVTRRNAKRSRPGIGAAIDASEVVCGHTGHFPPDSGD